MGGLATLGILVATVAGDQAEVTRFKADLVKLRTEFRSIYIEFKLTRKDVARGREHTGKLLMLRDKDRGLLGLLELTPADLPEDKETWVLRGEELYEFQHRSRTVVNYRAAKEDAFAFVAEVIPGLWLLDAAESGKRCEVQLLTRDKNYKYFAVKVGRLATEYRFAVAARDAGGYPRGAIRQAAVLHPNGTQESWQITKWAVDADAKLTAADFPDPAKMEEWKMAEWPGWKGFLEQLLKKSE